MEIFLMRMRGMKKNKPVREVVLMVEDCYGGEFFKRLINELNESEFLNYKIKFSKVRGKRNPIHMPYICNDRMRREIIAVDNLTKTDKIIIILDGDKNQGKYQQNLNRARRHIPNNIKTPYSIVVFDYEVEEWICISLNIKWSSKPSDALKSKFKYKKQHLPNYVDKLDFNKLKEVKSFNDFVNALNN